MSDFLVFLHIFFVALLLSAIGVTNFASIKLRRTDDVREFGLYLNMGKTVGIIVPIAAIAASIFGVAAAQQIGYSLTAGWLIAAYVLIVLALVIPGMTLVRWSKAAEGLMPQALAEGRILDGQKAAVLSTRFVAVEFFLNVLLVLFLADMVFKPF